MKLPDRLKYLFPTASLVAGAIIIALSGIHCSQTGDSTDSPRMKKSDQTVSPALAGSQSGAQTYVYECGDTLSFVARVEGETAWLFLPGRTVKLMHVPAASGVKYSDGEITFWRKGGEALLVTHGKTYRDCKNNSAAAAWEHAKLNGADFRAVGNEPGWHLEIRRGATIDFVTDYSQTRYSFKTPGPVTDNDLKKTTYTMAENGHKLTVILELKPHSDTMADVTYPTTVTVILDGRAYHGGGRALH